MNNQKPIEIQAIQEQKPSNFSNNQIRRTKKKGKKKYIYILKRKRRSTWHDEMGIWVPKAKKTEQKGEKPNRETRKKIGRVD